MTKQILTPDICVIGAGAGGLSVAAAAAAFGVPVVLVEQSRMGGEHLNYGCVPSKALLAAARRVASLKDFPKFGVTAEGTVDFAKVHAHMRGVIVALAPTDAAERFTGLGVRVIAGTAQFTDRATVSVGDDIEIKARRFVIATGSSPAAPLMQGLDTVDYLTNETVFDLTELPEHLVVIGAGTVGLELAQAFRRFGSAVSVIEVHAALSDEEPECADAVTAALEKDGVTIYTGASVKQVGRTEGGIAVTYETAGGTQTISGSHLLITAGRRPNVDALDLKAARIKVDANGIRVNRKLKTSNRRVYAIGDVTGGPPLTHFANYQAGQVIRNALFRLPVKINHSIIPRVTFTGPRDCAGRFDRSRCGQEIPHAAHCSLVVPRQRPRPGGARDPWPDQGHHRQARKNPWRHHCRRAGRRADLGVGACNCAGPQHPRHGGPRGALPDTERHQQARGAQLFHARRAVSHAAAHHRVAAQTRVASVFGNEALACGARYGASFAPLYNPRFSLPSNFPGIFHMKLVCFDDYKLGVLKGADTVVEITPVVRDAAQGDPRLLINAVIEKFADYRGKIDKAVADGKGIPLASVKLRAPVPRPVQYRLHGGELRGGDGSHAAADQRVSQVTECHHRPGRHDDPA